VILDERNVNVLQEIRFRSCSLLSLSILLFRSHDGHATIKREHRADFAFATSYLSVIGELCRRVNVTIRSFSGAILAIAYVINYHYLILHNSSQVRRPTSTSSYAYRPDHAPRVQSSHFTWARRAQRDSRPFLCYVKYMRGKVLWKITAFPTEKSPQTGSRTAANDESRDAANRVRFSHTLI